MNENNLSPKSRKAGVCQKNVCLQLSRCGALQTARESVITVLRVRWGEVPSTLQETINSEEDLSKLKQLHEIAITVNSLQEFERSAKGGPTRSLS